MRKTMLTLALVAAGVLGYASPASASAVDPTGGAGGDILADASSWITGQGVPLIVGLLVIGIIVSLLVKFAKRGAKSA